MLSATSPSAVSVERLCVACFNLCCTATLRSIASLSSDVTSSEACLRTTEKVSRVAAQQSVQPCSCAVTQPMEVPKMLSMVFHRSLCNRVGSLQCMMAYRSLYRRARSLRMRSRSSLSRSAAVFPASLLRSGGGGFTRGCGRLPSNVNP